MKKTKVKAKKTIKEKATKTSFPQTSIKTVAKKPSAGLRVDVFNLQGRNIGKVSLPKEIFGQTPNQNLIAQAIRVYFTNQSVHSAHTKTRAEVRGGGVKPWRQKGTGRARAGSIRSPIWVGGGKALGPRKRDIKLVLPQKMKRKALIYVLSSKLKSDEIKVIANIEKIEPKTKILANLLSKVTVSGPTLLVVSGSQPTQWQNIKLASRNIPQVTVDMPQNLNAYEIISNNNILFSREALAYLSTGQIAPKARPAK